MTSKQKHTYSTSDLGELTKEINRRVKDGYYISCAPSFTEGTYSVEFEIDGDAVPVTGIILPVLPADSVLEPVTEKVDEPQIVAAVMPPHDAPKPAHKPRGPKPKKTPEA